MTRGCTGQATLTRTGNFTPLRVWQQDLAPPHPRCNQRWRCFQMPNPLHAMSSPAEKPDADQQLGCDVVALGCWGITGAMSPGLGQHQVSPPAPTGQGEGTDRALGLQQGNKQLGLSGELEAQQGAAAFCSLLGDQAAPQRNHTEAAKKPQRDPKGAATEPQKPQRNQSSHQEATKKHQRSCRNQRNPKGTPVLLAAPAPRALLTMHVFCSAPIHPALMAGNQWEEEPELGQLFLIQCVQT